MSQKQKIIFLVFLFSFIFLRFWEINSRNVFSWDQLDNAWMAKTMIIDHYFPLNGMAAKGNSGFFIGPGYYYLIVPFYLIFNLNPFASGIIAGLTSLFFFFALYFLLKKLFSVNVSLFALFLTTFSFAAIQVDRVQWPVNFIPLVSLAIFYFLYKFLTEDEKYLIPLSLVLGFSFHIHFTSIFYLLIILFCLPFFPRTKKLIKYGFVSLPLFLIWFLSTFISLWQTSGAQAASLNKYLSSYYHGFHLVRFLQLSGDAFIQFDKVLGILPFWSTAHFLKYLFLPFFFFIYFFLDRSKKRFTFVYLIFLWFLVPWLVFATYKGEISDYYFTISYPLVLMVISYLVLRVWQINNFLPKIFLGSLIVYYLQLNLNNFFKYTYEKNINYYKNKVSAKISAGEKIEFQEGVPESYLYYYYTRK